MSKQVMLHARGEDVLEWVTANVGKALPQPTDPKFIPFAIGDEWTLFVYSRNDKPLVEAWLPDEAATAATLRFFNADKAES